MNLTRPAVTELTVESAPLLLLHEWLSYYFDGNAHPVGSNPANLSTFPKVRVRFGLNQPPPSQPLAEDKEAVDQVDAWLLVVLLPRASQTHDSDTVLASGKLATDHVLFNFWIFAKQAGVGQSEYLAQTIAQLLRALLANPEERYPLAEKGVTHLQPQLPQWLTNTDYARRLVPCAAQLQYAIEFGGTPPLPPVDGEVSTPFYGEQVVPFFHEEPLVTGSYLLGEYQWSRGVRLVKAAIVAAAPQTDPVVVELEINGVLTGRQLTLAADAPLVEVRDELDLELLLVSSGVLVRWKVVSAPGAEASAFRVALSLHLRPT